MRLDPIRMRLGYEKTNYMGLEPMRIRLRYENGNYMGLEPIRVISGLNDDENDVRE